MSMYRAAVYSAPRSFKDALLNEIFIRSQSLIQTQLDFETQLSIKKGANVAK